MPLDRTFTLKNSVPFILENDYGRKIEGSLPLGFIYPRPCDTIAVPGGSCGEYGRFSIRDLRGDQAIGFTPLVAEEFRDQMGPLSATEAGLSVTGNKGAVSFFLDARMFAESGRSKSHTPFDREGVDIQNDSLTGTVSFDSYARYRGNLSYDSPIGRFTAARDAVHWGPGLFSNLTFHQDAVPFNQYSFSTSLGPLSVITLYGDLAIDDHYISTENLKDKNLYAHRYELSVGNNLLVGLSEQLILYEQNKPYLFVPIFPLFIAKGFMFEHANNGNLAMDATYRRPGLGMIYTEFLLDDLESPSSLFTKDYRQNKWAWMAGAHAMREIGRGTAGVIFEYARIQPWVYTHFVPNTAQTSNLGYPLGNQLGPNSQSVIAKAYYRLPRGAYASLKLSLLWKGRGEGSSLSDPFHDPFEPAEFLKGAGEPRFLFNPFLSYRWKAATLEAETGRFTSEDWRIRIAFAY